MDVTTQEESYLSSLFIAGNGFDIAHGIPTKYSEFRTFLIEKCPEAFELRDEVIFLEDISAIDQYEFSIEILLNTMDKSAGENWWNFEDALALINFDNKFPKPNHKENETEEEDNALMVKYLLYMDALSSVFISCSKVWQDLFGAWIKTVQKYIESGSCNARPSLESLFQQEDIQFLTFNYTKTLQTIYGIKKVIHLHNRIGQNLIFGHGRTDITYGRSEISNFEEILISSSDLDDMIMSFKKDTMSPFKKYSDFFKRLNSSVDKVYSYGFSYSEVDSVYIKKIIEKISPDATWYFTEFESNNKEEFQNKKDKLRGYGFKGSFGIYRG